MSHTNVPRNCTVFFICRDLTLYKVVWHLLFLISALGAFYVPFITQRTNSFKPHPKDEAMVKCLAQGHMCQDWDSNPHSADHNHQSLIWVLIIARPQR